MVEKFQNLLTKSFQKAQLRALSRTRAQGCAGGEVGERWSRPGVAPRGGGGSEILQNLFKMFCGSKGNCMEDSSWREFAIAAYILCPLLS